jgi:hypothetical protein
LAAFVRLLRTLSAVGIIEKMIAFAFRHGRPFGVRALINNDYRVRLRRKLAAGNGRVVLSVGLHLHPSRQKRACRGPRCCKLL